MARTAEQTAAAVEEALGDDELLWFGVRGADAQPLLAIPQFARCFSTIAPLESISLSEEACIESLNGARVDLETTDFEDDASSGANAVRNTLARAVANPSVLVSYRPLAFLSTMAFLRDETVRYLSLFHEQQAPFEHKPWVEREVRRLGIPTVDWRYYHASEVHHAAPLLRHGPAVLRLLRSTGGAGLRLVRHAQDLAASGTASDREFFAVAPYLAGALPLNIGACAFRDGTVTLHAPSVQLIGIPQCTRRPFGYCGNDFAAFRRLDPRVLRGLEAIAQAVGKWLVTQGYVGAFGIDALWHGGQVLFTELNPRFQGSSLASAELDAAAGRPSIYLDHMAAHLGLPPPPREPLAGIVSRYPDLAQVIVHNRSDTPVAWAPRSAGRWTLEPASNVQVNPDATMARLVVDGPVTEDGYSLNPATSEILGRQQNRELFLGATELQP